MELWWWSLVEGTNSFTLRDEEGRSEKRKKQEDEILRCSLRGQTFGERAKEIELPCPGVQCSNFQSFFDQRFNNSPGEALVSPFLGHFNFSIFDRQVCDLGPRLLPCFSFPFTHVQEKYYYSTRVSDSIHSQFPSRNDYELTRTCIPFPFIKIDKFFESIGKRIRIALSWREIRNRVLFKKN